MIAKCEAYNFAICDFVRDVFDANNNYITTFCDTSSRAENYDAAILLCSNAGMTLYDGSTTDRLNGILNFARSTYIAINWYYSGQIEGQCAVVAPSENFVYSAQITSCSVSRYVFCEGIDFSRKFNSLKFISHFMQRFSKNLS